MHSKPIKNVHIMSNVNFNSKKIFTELALKLRKNGFNLVKNFTRENVDLIISIGGDGSFLRTCNNLNYPPTLFTGINTGHLGFFQDTVPTKIDELISKIKARDYTVQKIIPLSAEIVTSYTTYNIKAINEFSVKAYKNKVAHLNLFIDDNYIQHFSGDGIIASSSTGSTGYNYSAKGAIIDSRLNLIELTPIAPINTKAYRSFNSSMILPYRSKVKIEPVNAYYNKCVVLADAKYFLYDSVKKIKIQYSDDEIHLLRPSDYEFFKKVREKFL